jgi:Arc/MetJ family transcription regulator
MSRMTVTVDEALVDEAKKVLGAGTRAEAIRLALEEAVRKRRLQAALDLEGKIAFVGDEKDLLRLREVE